jgi:DNA-directed RNA polymerase specialized sigma24 family protein
MSEDNGSRMTSIQITAQTRDRLYRLKFRRTYDQFLNELCDLYEETVSGEGKSSP